MHLDLKCNLCDENARQSDSHLLVCSTISEKCEQLSQYSDAKHADIFSTDLGKQLIVTKIYEQIFKIKMELDISSS